MDKDYILFDLDGTITDSKIGILKSVQYSLKSFGIDVKDMNELICFVGPPLRDSFMKYYSFNDTDAEKAVVKYREYFAKTGIFENDLYEGIGEFLEKLKLKGKKIILATSKPTVFAERILKHFDIDRYFIFVSGSELDGQRSKKSEVIRYALVNCGITSIDKAVMVGDREHDVLGAKELGMDSIGVTYGYGGLCELTDAGATYTINSVMELEKLLISD